MTHYLFLFLCNPKLSFVSVNKSKVLYGIPRDPDVLATMAQLEKEEIEAANEEDKPKVQSVSYAVL